MSEDVRRSSQDIELQNISGTESGIISSNSIAQDTGKSSESVEEPPLHIASQQGDLERISSLLSEGGHDVNKKDSQDATALHWAAINGHLDACKLLLEAGADIDALGGQLLATPVQWACRNGHVYVVHYLLEKGANPLAEDQQKFNILHLAVHSSSSYLVAYVLMTQSEIAVDSRDNEGHTPLHWACYQGDQISIDLLIRAGANPDTKDNAGFTALHWSVVKGDAMCIEILIKSFLKRENDFRTLYSRRRRPSRKSNYFFKNVDDGDGSNTVDASEDNENNTSETTPLSLLSLMSSRGTDSFNNHDIESGYAYDTRNGITRWLRYKDNQGRTPEDVAQEMKTSPSLKAGLALARLDSSGFIRRPRNGLMIWILDSQRRVDITLALAAFFMLTLTLASSSIFPAWGILIVFIGTLIAQQALFESLVLTNSQIVKSPYLYSLQMTTILHIGYLLVTRFMGFFGSLGPAGSLKLLVISCLCFIAIIWTLTKTMMADPGYIRPSANERLSDTVKHLCDEGRFDPYTFCLICETRRPIRARHSNVSEKCVALFDHYCPWTYNDIGLKNHRVFTVFILLMNCGIIFLLLPLGIRYISLLPRLDDLSGCIVNDTFCSALAIDTYAVLILIWAGLQLSWLPVLLLLQLWQISRQMTTAEVTAASKYGFMGAMSHPSDVRAPHKHRTIPCASLMKILGIDRFVSGTATKGLVKTNAVTNPFSRNVLMNCYDFWTLGGGLGIDYMNLYDVPAPPLS